MRVTSLFAALALAIAFTTQAYGEPQQTDQGLTFEVWSPNGFTDSRSHIPLIIFSHGFGGCARQSTFLTKALADDGYLVVAPNHADARCGEFRADLRPEAPFRDGNAWSDTTYRARHDDIENLLGFLLSHAPYADHIDRERIAIAGHSLGGYTALGMAGAWPSWKDVRVKAVLALSPYAKPFIDKGALGAMAVPVMFQGGTLDMGITPFVSRAGGVYDHSSHPKYFVEFKRAGHLAWTDFNPLLHEEINAYALAFFDHYLKGRAEPLLDAARDEQVAAYRVSP